MFLTNATPRTINVYGSKDKKKRAFARFPATVYLNSLLSELLSEKTKAKIIENIH